MGALEYLLAKDPLLAAAMAAIVARCHKDKISGDDKLFFCLTSLFNVCLSRDVCKKLSWLHGDRLEVGRSEKTNMGETGRHESVVGRAKVEVGGGKGEVGGGKGEGAVIDIIHG